MGGRPAGSLGDAGSGSEGPVIGVDTSVIVRYLMQDPPDAARRATVVVEGDHSLGISVVVILETVHVLRTQYGVARPDIISSLIELLTRENVLVLGLSRDEALEALVQARSLSQSPIADALIVAMARSAGAVPLYTFDRGMGRHGIPVAAP